MDSINVVIVDDSPFTVAIIQEILEYNGFKVVGSADCLEEVKEIVDRERPKLVTMDISMPDTDGFECIRAIHAIDPSIKVVVASSMKDEEIVEEAARHNVGAYIQKPIEADELIAAVRKAMSDKDLFESLQEEYFEVFKKSLKDGVYKMAKSHLIYKDEYLWDKAYNSEGVAVDVGIIGEFSGKMIINLSKTTAKVLAATILKRNPKSSDEVIAMVGEFANIVSGNACSALNKNNRGYSLRVAPPSVMVGKNMLISPPNFPTYSATAETVFGRLLLNVGFKGSE